jgi:hypothetical protein
MWRPYGTQQLTDAAGQQIWVTELDADARDSAVRRPRPSPCTTARHPTDASKSILRLRHLRDLVAAFNADHAPSRLRAMIDDHHTDNGVLFDSSASTVTAHRR